MTDMSNWTSAEKLEYIPILQDILVDIPPSSDTICQLSNRVRKAVLDIMYPPDSFDKKYPNTRGIVTNVVYAVALDCGDLATVSNEEGKIFFDSYREVGAFVNHLRESPQWDRAVEIKEFRTDD